MTSPTRESFPPIAQAFNTFTATTLPNQIHSPPSPHTHRLRKLQSAHNLGAAARISSQNSLISQQVLRHPQGHPQESVPPLTRNANNRSPQRNRANSDATPPPPLPPPTPSIFPNNLLLSLNHKRSALSKASRVADAMSLDRLIREGPPDGDVNGALESARLKVLDQGIRSDGDGMSRTRIYFWLIFIDAPILDTDEYLGLIHRGASPAYSKIRNDTFRTLTTDPLFRRRVSEASLIRLLNAIAWKLHDAKEERRPTSSRLSLAATESAGSSRSDISQTDASSPSARNRARALTLTTEGSDATTSEPGTYVQGMNVLAAPFLYAARSEVEAFAAFHTLLTKECPGYIRGAMDGVHRGLALVDKVLAIVDPKLSFYLTSKGLSAEIYAFPSVLTLCACTPPLPEVLKHWDFLFAYGPQLNIVCIVAQLIMMRNELLTSLNPNKLLRSFPALRAEMIKRTALAIIRMIPDDIYADIIRHAL
ncbi:TBC-domain-containing protein [Daldinia vernicosa]|uniref:TBC-domain-containing protein n=1 Tax=Daldinia vernicosa TaxID=114800 RepID=UPI0020079885|nr:TBC-domain-containing protein [Daldinia vernicosa]KAI0848891.1 TBC-domain-containing protein [Daldinia vernicosa]